MCFLRLGNLASLLSESLVNGFTTGAAIHVLVSQLKDLFGITMPRHKGVFQAIYVRLYISLYILLLALNVFFIFFRQ